MEAEKSRKKNTKELDIGSIVLQTSLIKNLILAKGYILEKKVFVK